MKTLMPKLKLYYISQTTNTGYDTYDSAVVASFSEDEARATHPDNEYGRYESKNYPTWVPAADVAVKYIGDAAPEIRPGVVCASFNAG